MGESGEEGERGRAGAIKAKGILCIVVAGDGNAGRVCEG